MTFKRNSVGEVAEVAVVVMAFINVGCCDSASAVTDRMPWVIFGAVDER